MASQSPYRQTVSGSIGAGVGALISPNKRRYYILEHKVSSKYHRAGETQEIIVDNIEIGRDPRCQVRFDDEKFPTVSRHHAAIVRDGDGWRLIQISKTNSTLLNGMPIKDSWFLQNGDEIQLSVNGPKLGFIVPSGKKSTVGSIALTHRLSLFRQQALRPYKTAIAILSAVLVLAVGGLIAWNLLMKKDLGQQSLLLAEQIEANKENKQIADSLANELTANNKKLADYEKRMAEMKREVARANSNAAAAWNRANRIAPSVGTTGELAEYAKNVYLCVLGIYFDDEIISVSYGTGFLLDDGRFVTAQHVVNPMLYPDVTDQSSLMLNALLHQEPSEFECRFYAISPTGDKITRTYTPDKNPFHMGHYAIETLTTTEVGDMILPVKCAQNYACDYRDYAWIKTSKSGGLPFDNNFSTTMPAATHLFILGYPQLVGAEDISNVSPIFSESSVAREGLDVDGCILLSNNETDHGNSGGPVLAVRDGRYIVIGLISGANRLGSKTGNSSDGKWKDRVVPIARVK